MTDLVLSYNYGNSLQHAGVKGMKWGVRKARPTGGGTVAKAKGPTGKEIRAAREANRASFKKSFKEATMSGKVSMAVWGERSKALPASHLNNPDRQTALRLTKGEKAFLAISALSSPVSAGGSAAVVLSRQLAMRNKGRTTK